jgi:hypothetical protein
LLKAAKQGLFSCRILAHVFDAGVDENPVGHTTLKHLITDLFRVDLQGVNESVTSLIGRLEEAKIVCLPTNPQ